MVVLHMSELLVKLASNYFRHSIKVTPFYEPTINESEDQQFKIFADV